MAAPGGRPVPPLPPRPASGPSRLTAHSSLSFPPPPPSPNRRPNPPRQQQRPPFPRRPVGPAQTPPLPFLSGPAELPAQTTSAAPTHLSACIDTPMAFAATWFTHNAAPDAAVCSRCYVDHIQPTVFRDAFFGTACTDGFARLCRFQKPHLTERLWPAALATGDLQPTLQFLQRRAHLPDCGTHATRQWFQPRDDTVPGLLVCEACYEDTVAGGPLAGRFRPSPSGPDTSCSLSLPFVRKELAARTSAADWTGFVAEARARLQMTCPRLSPVPNRQWFVPADARITGLALCAACYCDHVLKSGDEGQWTAADAARLAGDVPACCMAVMGLATAMRAAERRGDTGLFWRAVAARQPVCVPKGVQGRWFTLQSPAAGGGAVCGACRVAVVDALGIGGLFAEDASLAGTVRLCALQPAAPQSALYWSWLRELALTGGAGGSRAPKEGLRCMRDKLGERQLSDLSI